MHNTLLLFSLLATPAANSEVPNVELAKGSLRASHSAETSRIASSNARNRANISSIRSSKCDGCDSPVERCCCGQSRRLFGHLHRPPRKDYRFSYIPPLSNPPQPNEYYYFRPYNYIHVVNHQADAALWGGGAYHPYSNEIFERIYQEFDAESIPLPADGNDANPEPPARLPNPEANPNNPFEPETSTENFEASSPSKPPQSVVEKPGVLEILKNLKPLSGDQTSSRRSYLQDQSNE